MTLALDAAKDARDRGRNVAAIRKELKQARAAFEGGDYATAARIAEEILRDLDANSAGVRDSTRSLTR